MIESIRLKAGNYFLKKELRNLQRTPQVVNFKDSKTIGILYKVTENNDYNFICDFVKYFQDNGKTVKALGYVIYKEVPHFCFPKLSFDYFTQKDIGWNMIPKNQFVKDFMDDDFDIMIDLSIQDCFPTNYVSALSKAKFKIGRFNSENQKFYDFMLNVSDETSIKDYISHLTHYLSIFNNSSHEQ
ncbi:MAG: hypothetical protein HXX09_06660 [Bacteroidetes bacterium]|nr:hypothetical protein [Bacteroidota bacterium]